MKSFYRTDNTNKLSCKFLFIGESPGVSESVIGQPFVGPAGKELDRLLQLVGIEDYGMTNTIACFPPEEGTAKSKYRKPNKDEIENCRQRLDELVEIVMPSFYIALGNVAKSNPPTGVRYHLELDHPLTIIRQTPNRRKVIFNRNKNKLKSFLKEISNG